MNSLSLRYSHPLLIRLLEKDEIMKTDLMDIVKNIQTLDKLLKNLESDGLVSIKEKIMGRKTFYVSLTAKGKAIAMELKKADDIASGRSIPKESISVELPKELYDDVLDIIENNARWKSLEDYVIEAVKEKNDKENPGKGSVKRLPREER